MKGLFARKPSPLLPSHTRIVVRGHPSVGLPSLDSIVAGKRSATEIGVLLRRYPIGTISNVVWRGFCGPETKSQEYHTNLLWKIHFLISAWQKDHFRLGSGWVMWASLFNSVQGGKNWLRTSMRCASVGRPYFSRKLRCFAWKDEPTKCRQWENNIGLDSGNPGVTPVQPVDDSRTLKLNHKYFVNFI